MGMQYEWSSTSGGSLPWWFYALFIGIGLVFTVVGACMLLSTQRFVAGAATTQGTVVDWALHHDSDDGGSMYYPIVQFTAADGQRIEFEGNTGSNYRSFHKGAQVKVYYDPQDPQQARIGVFSELWLWDYLFLGMGLLFMAIGIAVWFAVRRTSARAPASAAVAGGPSPRIAAAEEPGSPFNAQELADIKAAESAAAAPTPLGSADELQLSEDEPAGISDGSIDG